MPTKAIALIDGPHLYSVGKALQYTVDFKQLLKLLRVFDGQSLVRAYYYTHTTIGAEYDSLRPLLDWLDYNGYTVVERPVRDDSNRRRDCNIEMSVTALEVGPTVNRVVLFAGSEDMVSAVEALKRRGVEVVVVSSIATRPISIHDRLRRAADTFIDLADIQPEIEKRQQS